MGACVVDFQKISGNKLGKHTVRREFVCVFAHGADHIPGGPFQRAFLPRGGNVVIRLIHHGTHQIGSRRVRACDSAESISDVIDSCDKKTRRTRHPSSKLRIDRNARKRRSGRFCFKDSADRFRHGLQIQRTVFRPVGNPQAAGYVKECDPDPGPGGQVFCNGDQAAAYFRIIIRFQRVAGQIRMESD